MGDSGVTNRQAVCDRIQEAVEKRIVGLPPGEEWESREGEHILAAIDSVATALGGDRDLLRRWYEEFMWQGSLEGSGLSHGESGCGGVGGEDVDEPCAVGPVEGPGGVVRSGGSVPAEELADGPSDEVAAGWADEEEPVSAEAGSESIESAQDEGLGAVVEEEPAEGGLGSDGGDPAGGLQGDEAPVGSGAGDPVAAAWLAELDLLPLPEDTRMLEAAYHLVGEMMVEPLGGCTFPRAMLVELGRKRVEVRLHERTLRELQARLDRP